LNNEVCGKEIGALARRATEEVTTQRKHWGLEKMVTHSLKYRYEV
jgi:hypothetical protein